MVPRLWHARRFQCRRVRIAFAGSAQRDLAQWITAIDEEATAGRQGGCDSLPRYLAYLGVTSVKRPDPDREHQIEGGFARQEFEILGGAMAHAELPGSDLRTGVALDLGHTCRRPVDHQDMTITDSAGNFPGSGSWGTTDFEHPHARP